MRSIFSWPPPRTTYRTRTCKKQNIDRKNLQAVPNSEQKCITINTTITVISIILMCAWKIINKQSHSIAHIANDAILNGVGRVIDGNECARRCNSRSHSTELSVSSEIRIGNSNASKWLRDKRHSRQPAQESNKSDKLRFDENIWRVSFAKKLK